MSYNGAGIFQLVSGNPVVTGTLISSTWANNTLQDIANNGLSNCITKDGQQTVTANIPFGGFRLTGIANAVNLQDAVSASQLQNGGLITLGTVAGTDTITATASPTPLAYVAGQRFQFVAAGTNATGNPTLNISGLGAKNITKNGTQTLIPGDIASGALVTVIYDGTQFQLQTTSSISVGGPVGSSRNVSMVVASASATATLTADEIIVETALGGTAFKLSSFSKSINLATTGAGGMDTGSAPVSGYVAIYAIYNPTTGASALLAQNANALRSEVYSGSNMPSGYTASALLGVIPTNASSQFTNGALSGRKWTQNDITVYNANGAIGVTLLSISGAAPSNARRCDGWFLGNNTGANASALVSLYSTSTQIGRKRWEFITVQANGTQTIGFSNLEILTSQTVWLSVSAGTGTPGAQVAIVSYEV